MYRHIPSRPIGGVLSSQVGSKTGTSPDTAAAVQITFKYNVSPMIHGYLTHTLHVYVHVRVIILQ